MGAPSCLTMRTPAASGGSVKFPENSQVKIQPIGSSTMLSLGEDGFELFADLPLAPLLQC
jgi:hypothetical protein